jgi:hypothetical protein
VYWILTEKSSSGMKYIIKSIGYLIHKCNFLFKTTLEGLVSTGIILAERHYRIFKKNDTSSLEHKSPLDFLFSILNFKVSKL